MKYSDFSDSRSFTTEIQEFLMDGADVSVALCIPKNHRVSAKQAFFTSGLTCDLLVKQAMINNLSKKG